MKDKEKERKKQDRQEKTEKGRSFGYVEPADYFPESIRKKCKLGEYAKDDSDNEK